MSPEIDIEADTPPSPRDTADIARLLPLAESLGLDPIDLDPEVHDAAATYASAGCNRHDADDGLSDALYTEAGRQAAEVNNCGLPKQVAYLITQLGAARAEEIIRKDAPQVTPPPSARLHPLG